MTPFFKGNKVAACAANLCFIFFLLASTNTLAITYTFAGDGSWSDASHWTPGIPLNPLPSGSAIVITSDCVLTSDLTFEAGSTLTINPNRDLNVTNYDITNSGTIYKYGSMNSDAGFVFTNNSSGLFINEGIIFDYGILDNAGTIQNSGNWYANGSDYINTGTFQINSGGEFILGSGNSFDNSGVFEINSSATLNNMGNFTNNGTLMGQGNFQQDGTFTNSSTGIIAPGASPGKLTVSGDVDLGDGTYRCEINETGQGTDYDWLDVSGTATIGPSSKLNIVFGYTPLVGTTFDILTASSVSGNFDLSNITFSGGGVEAISANNLGGNTIQVEVSSLLPVELVSFTATEQHNQILLNWSTASEQNNRGFEVQRSSNGKNWGTLGFMIGNGTATNAHHYVYLDEKPLSGFNYYRLRQIDFDDKAQYSPTVSIKIKQADNGISLFPNPAKDEVSLDFEFGYTGEATLILYGPTGEQIRRETLLLEGSAAHSNIGLSGLPSGIYLLEIQAGSEQWLERLVVK